MPAVRFLSLMVYVLLIGQAALSEPGFLQTGDPHIPFSVRQATRSVFLLYSGGGHLNQVADMRQENKIKDLASLFDSQKMSWQLSQLVFCKLRSIDFCPILDQTAHGSAFLLGSNRRLVSVLHMFSEDLTAYIDSHEWSNEKDLREHIVQLPIFFGLLDQKLKSKVDIVNDYGMISFFNPDIRLFGKVSMVNTYLGMLSDLIELNMTTSVGRPLIAATEQPKTGATVYLIGYPKETKDRRLIGAEDSDGESLRVSIGKIISAEEWQKRTGSGPYSPEVLFKNQMIFTDTDCEHGNSGGPLVNSRGEVIGIFTRVYDKLSGRQPQDRVCGFINTTDKRVLDSRWLSLGRQ